MKKLAFLFIAIVGYTMTANAQATVTTSNSATATIITPLAMIAVNPMAFGNITNTTPGTVVMTAAGSRSTTGGVTLPTPTGTFNAASFTVTGGATNIFTITLPASAITLTDAGLHTMTLDTFTSNPSGTGTLVGGTLPLAVGGTLHLGATQGVGSYTGSFAVTVNYN